MNKNQGVSGLVGSTLCKKGVIRVIEPKITLSLDLEALITLPLWISATTDPFLLNDTSLERPFKME